MAFFICLKCQNIDFTFEFSKLKFLIYYQTLDKKKIKMVKAEQKHKKDWSLINLSPGQLDK